MKLPAITCAIHDILSIHPTFNFLPTSPKGLNCKRIVLHIYYVLIQLFRMPPWRIVLFWGDYLVAFIWCLLLIILLCRYFFQKEREICYKLTCQVSYVRSRIFFVSEWKDWFYLSIFFFFFPFWWTWHRTQNSRGEKKQRVLLPNLVYRETKLLRCDYHTVTSWEHLLPSQQHYCYWCATPRRLPKKFVLLSIIIAETIGLHSTRVS